jgi:NAD(P)-dependent dehydrogenase (short-subunit alcohol dehydrogenase family)
MGEQAVARSLEGKTCLVTGATSGIGLVTALELARRGARVIGVGRSPERCAEAARQIQEQTGTTAVEFLVADLSSQGEIRKLASLARAGTSQLDVLVNNAGLIRLQRELTVDGLEMTFALNHLAYFLLTNLLLDTLKASAPARIVNVSSAAHQGSKLDFDDLQAGAKYSPWRAYRRSKLANILFTRELARRLEGTGVSAYALHPGFVRTQIFRDEGFKGWLMRRASELFAITPEKGAQTSIYLATATDLNGQSGEYFINRKPARSSPESQDDVAARRLWEESAKLTGVSPA